MTMKHPWILAAIVLAIVLVGWLSTMMASDSASPGIARPATSTARPGTPGSPTPQRAPSAGPVSDTEAEPPPAFDINRAHAWIDEVKPAVEAVTGRTLPKRPTVNVLNRTDIAKGTAEDVLVALRALYPTAQNQDLLNRAMQGGSGVSLFILGTFIFSDSSINLASTNVMPLLEAAELDAALMPGLVKLAIAEQLTHALQQQEADILGQLRDSRNEDEVAALMGIIDGQAAAVRIRVAEKLNLTEALKAYDLLRTRGAFPRALPDPGPTADREAVATIYRTAQRHARTFAEAIIDTKGMDGLWSIVAAPPAKASMLEHPDTYAPRQRASVPIGAVVEAFESTYTAPAWRSRRAPMTPLTLKPTIDALPDATQQGVIAGALLDGVMVQFEEGQRGIILSVRLAQFQNPDAARMMIDAAERQSRQNLDRAKAAGTITYSDFVSEPIIADLRADVARRTSFIMTAASGLRGPSHTVRAAAGDTFIEITATGPGSGEIDPTDLALQALGVLRPDQPR